MMSNDFILDEDFEYFLEKFGSPIEQVACSQATLDKFKGKLPDRLLEYWQEYGFCGFKEGLFWIVNPDDYEDIMDEWLEHTDLPDQDIYHVFARNAFGDLFLWGEKTGFKYEITAANGWIIEQEGNAPIENDFSVKCFFGINSLAKHDVKDLKQKTLFVRAVKKFGALKSDEMFGFEPSLMVGGEPLLQNLNKVNIYIHLSILAQYGQIEVLDHKALMKKAFS